MSVEQQAHAALFPTSQFFRWQGLKEFRAYVKLALEHTRFAIPALVCNRDEPHDRLVAAGNDDRLAAAGLLDEPGELSLGFVNGDGFHDEAHPTESLAN
jgi:hypothetical protein